MAYKYEIEIKSLLGSKDRAEKLKLDLKKKFKDIKLVKSGYQNNHYFNEPDRFDKLLLAIGAIINADKLPELEEVFRDGKNFSIRSKDDNGKIYFVVKSSIGDDTSINGISRIEFDSPVSVSFEELDQIILNAGLTHQSKWSRQREEFKNSDLSVTVDKNAGYGYLAEFEKVIDDSNQAEQIKDDLLKVMAELGVEELPQDRLERMFNHYTNNWPEYYGTDKTFLIN